MDRFLLCATKQHLHANERNNTHTEPTHRQPGAKTTVDFFSRHDFCDDRFLAKAFFDVLNFKIILRFNETSHKLENYVEK